MKNDIIGTIGCILVTLRIKRATITSLRAFVDAMPALEIATELRHTIVTDVNRLEENTDATERQLERIAMESPSHEGYLNNMNVVIEQLNNLRVARSRAFETVQDLVGLSYDNAALSRAEDLKLTISGMQDFYRAYSEFVDAAFSAMKTGGWEMRTGGTGFETSKRAYDELVATVDTAHETPASRKAFWDNVVAAEYCTHHCARYAAVKMLARTVFAQEESRSISLQTELDLLDAECDAMRAYVQGQRSPHLPDYAELKEAGELLSTFSIVHGDFVDMVDANRAVAARGIAAKSDTVARDILDKMLLDRPDYVNRSSLLARLKDTVPWKFVPRQCAFNSPEARELAQISLQKDARVEFSVRALQGDGNSIRLLGRIGEDPFILAPAPPPHLATMAAFALQDLQGKMVLVLKNPFIIVLTVFGIVNGRSISCHGGDLEMELKHARGTVLTANEWGVTIRRQNETLYTRVNIDTEEDSNAHQLLTDHIYD